MTLPVNQDTIIFIPNLSLAQLVNFLQQLELKYKKLNTAQHRVFASYTTNSVLYASQIPSWLKTTSISSFFERLQLKKPGLTIIV